VTLPVPREPAAVAERYARRGATERYSLLQPDVWLTVQERQRAMLRLFARLGWRTLADKRLLEVGCGSGGNLLEMLRLGFEPEHLSGAELLPERLEAARRSLPPAVTLWVGDAAQLPLPEGEADVVLVSTVFSSLLDEAFQQQLAQAVWRAVKPGGGVLWYDFTVDNPRNPDVRGVPVARIAQFFPQGRVQAQRLTLAPPLGRAAARLHPALWTLLNALPVLRTHVLAWVQK
jgi:SAM-dependent methyltransferase